MRAVHPGDAPRLRSAADRRRTGPAAARPSSVARNATADPSGDTRGNDVLCATSHRRVVDRQARGSCLKPVSQPQRLVAFSRDPVVPLLREAPSAKEVAHACPARNDRRKAARPSRHPGGRAFPLRSGRPDDRGRDCRTRSDGRAARRQDPIPPHPTAGPSSRAAAARNVSENRAPRTRPPSVSLRFVERRQPLDQVAAVEEVREGRTRCGRTRLAGRASRHALRRDGTHARARGSRAVRSGRRCRKLTLDRRVRERDDSVRREGCGAAIEDIPLIDDDQPDLAARRRSVGTRQQRMRRFGPRRGTPRVVLQPDLEGQDEVRRLECAVTRERDTELRARIGRDQRRGPRTRGSRLVRLRVAGPYRVHSMGCVRD